MMENNTLPCGYDADAMDCEDCAGFGECSHTKGLLIDEPVISINDQLIKALKSLGLVDIEAIKRAFDK